MTDAEYDAALEAIWTLLEGPQPLSDEDEARLASLTDAVEAYDQLHYPDEENP